jgi:hypothetical protein
MLEQMDAVASKHAKRGDQALVNDEVRQPTAAAVLPAQAYQLNAQAGTIVGRPPV